jgi:hypothetical protein
MVAESNGMIRKLRLRLRPRKLPFPELLQLQLRDWQSSCKSTRLARDLMQLILQ